MQRVDLNDVRFLLREYVRKSSRIGTFLANYEATGQLTSAAPMGTEPFIVSSTELVNNLNADMLDGHHASDFVLTVDAIDTIVLEAIDDRVANTLLQNTAAVTWVYDDPANTLTPTIDHAGLVGLGGDHHMLYSRVDGARNFTGDQIFEQDVTVLQRATVTNFTMPTGAVAGHILTSDAAGNATWTASSVGTHAGLIGLAADDHTQYLRTDGTRLCTGAQRFDTNVTVDDWLEIGYFKMPIGAAAGRVLTTDALGVGTWQNVVNTHAGLGGLTADDHPQYLYLYGRAGGQTMAGGSAAGEDLTIRSTDNITRGSILFGTSVYDEANNRLGICNIAPTYELDVTGTTRTTNFILPTGAADGLVLTSDPVGNATWELPTGSGGGGVSDHGALLGLGDDDHTQYILADGNRHFTGTAYLDYSIDVQASGIIRGSLSRGKEVTATGVNLALDTSYVRATNASIAGGSSNQISAGGTSGFIGGGTINSISGTGGVICGGQLNHATGTLSSILGGDSNTSSGSYSVAIGSNNTASTTYSSAYGRYANSLHIGSIIFADGTTTPFSSQINNEFAIQATGGFRVQGSGQFTDNIYTSGSVYADSYYGDGSNLTGIGAATNHSTLLNLAADDHTQYILVDGTRSFTGTVGGVTPVADADLTTKLYADNLVAASGALVENSLKIYVDEQIISGSGVTHHGALTGLLDDDHTQYVLSDGSRAMTKLDVDTSGTFGGAVQALTFYGDGSNLTGIAGGPGGGMVVGDAVTGGGVNRVLYEDGSENLATSANLTFDGTKLKINGGEIASDGSLDIVADDDESGLGILTLGVGHSSAIAINNDLHGGTGSIIIGADWEDYGGQPIMMYVGDNKTVSIDKEAITVSGIIMPVAATSGYVLTSDADGRASWTQATAPSHRNIRFVMDNGATAISTGLIDAQVKLPYGINLSEWSILATPSGSIELDVLMGDATSLPPTESITGTEQPSVTDDRYNSSTLLTGWTDTLIEGKILDVNVISCSGVTKCFLDLYGVEI